MQLSSFAVTVFQKCLLTLQPRLASSSWPSFHPSLPCLALSYPLFTREWKTCDSVADQIYHQSIEDTFNSWNLTGCLGRFCSQYDASVFWDGSVTVPVVTSRCLQTPWNHCDQTSLENVILGLGRYIAVLSLLFIFGALPFKSRHVENWKKHFLWKAQKVS